MLRNPIPRRSNRLAQPTKVGEIYKGEILTRSLPFNFIFEVNKHV